MRTLKITCIDNVSVFNAFRAVRRPSSHPHPPSVRARLRRRVRGRLRAGRVGPVVALLAELRSGRPADKVSAVRS